jgi:cobalt-zinc-cadmium resistance protein CzcA
MLFDRIVRFSIEHRLLVFGLVALAALVGLFNSQRLAIDAVPDITNTQVVVNTEAAGFTPLEVEQRITFPLETALGGLPHLRYTRSLSRYGLSQITLVFEDGTNIYLCRQLVTERLQEARSRIPGGLAPSLGPIATGLGEIFMYTVRAAPGAKKPDGSPVDITTLRSVQDWIVRPQLRTVPGVVEVNTIGGHERQIHVQPDPEKLAAFGLSLEELADVLERSHENVGAGYWERNGEQQLIRLPGQFRSPEEISGMVVAVRKGAPVFLSQVAKVGEGRELRTGAATKDGREVVLGTVFMLKGENSREVARRVADRLKRIAGSLPEGIEAVAEYDRSGLVEATIRTVRTNLTEGAILVMVVLFLLLGNIRAAVLTSAVIPLSMLMTITGMVSCGISGNLMSLGALDFGLIVDGAVIVVENCLRRLAEAQKKAGRPLDLRERMEVVFTATCEVRRASLYGELIIMVVYLPLLTFSGVEGKLYFPMAATVLMALASAMILSVTLIPAAVAVLLGGKIREEESPVFRGFRWMVGPALRFSLAHRGWVITGAAGMVLLSLVYGSRLGTEFMPSLDEGDVALHALRTPGTGLAQSLVMQDQLEREIRKIPEVKTVFSKIGTAEVATDPMPPSVADGFVILKDRSEWPDPRRPKADLVREMEERLRGIPGNNYEFTQPIQMRFNELLAGVRADVAVKIFGDDTERLLEAGEEIEAILKGIRGAADVKMEALTGLPILQVELDRARLGPLGLSQTEVQELVVTAMSGRRVGTYFEGDQRVPIRLQLAEEERNDPELLRRLPVPVPSPRGGAYVSLGDLANFSMETGLNQIQRENGKRRLVVTANVRGRDLGGFVEEAQGILGREVSLPEGYWLEWGGQFENLISAGKRLQLVVPLAVALILMLLYGALGSVRESLLVFSAVPLALSGGIAALGLRGIPISISAVVGFIALSGVAVLNGVVMITLMQRLIRQGMPLEQAVYEGGLQRLRAVLMTALVASLGFVPMALATGPGSEVQRPLATVVIGGIISSTLLTLMVLPALYLQFGRRKHVGEA